MPGGTMKRDRFIAALREMSEAAGCSIVVDKKLGKGSHYRIEVWRGDRMLAKTTLKSGELSPDYMKMVRKQLGLQS
jgi:hypothetical protein